MRVGGNIGQYTGNDFIVLVVFSKNFSQRAFLSEIFFCHILGEEDGIGAHQGSAHISFYKRERKNIQEGTVGIEYPMLFEFAVACSKQRGGWLGEPDRIFYHRQYRLKSLRHTRCSYGRSKIACIGSNAVYLFGILMEPIVTQFV